MVDFFRRNQMTNLEKYLRITNDIKQSVIDMNDLLAVHSFIESRVTDRQLSTVKNCAKITVYN